MTDPYRTSLHPLARAVEAFLSAPRREAITRRQELVAALLRVGPLDENLATPSPMPAEGSKRNQPQHDRRATK